MKKTGLAIMGLTAVLGISSAVGVCAATKKIIKFEDGKRVEIDVENDAGTNAAEVTEPADADFGGFEEDLDSAFTFGGETEGEAADEGVEDSLELGKFWGPVLENMSKGFLMDSKVQDGYQGEIVIHMEADKTLIVDSVTGFPAQEEQLGAGRMVYVYTSPIMTLSLPPQTTAELVLVNIPQDTGAPLYVKASGALETDGAGGYVLKTTTGEELKVPADCPITPYLTRQMVRLEDIAAGRKCLVWLDAGGQAEKIVLFNE